MPANIEDKTPSQLFTEVLESCNLKRKCRQSSPTSDEETDDATVDFGGSSAKNTGNKRHKGVDNPEFSTQLSDRENYIKHIETDFQSIRKASVKANLETARKYVALLQTSLVKCFSLTHIDKKSAEDLSVVRAELTAAKENITVLELEKQRLDSTVEQQKIDHEAIVVNLTQKLDVANKYAYKMKNYIENVHTKIKAAAKQWKNTAESHRVECEDSKKALKLSKAELEVLRKSVASSSAAVVLPDSNSLDGRHLNDTNKASTIKNLEEATKIQGTPHDKCVLDNTLLQLEVETQKIKLESYHIQNWVHQKKLKDQNKKLRTKLHEMERKLLLHDPVKSVNITELQIKLDTLSKELEVRAAERHEIESSNQNLLLKEHVNTHKLNEAQKELLSLKTQLHVMEGMLDMQSKQLQERTTDTEDMESLIQVLLVKERLNNDELQEARKELKLGLQDLLSQRSFIGIKRMGELVKS